MSYKTNDLYVSAYLRAKWNECRIERNSYNKFSFVFEDDVKDEVNNYINQINWENINASRIVNEIKSLKSYISNNS